MKTFLYLSIVVLSSSILLAQNYFPFPEDQRSFWKDGNQVVQYYCDQQQAMGADTSLLLFGADYLFPEGPCLDSIISFYLDNNYFGDSTQFHYPPQVDSMIFTAGRLYSSGQADQFIQINAEIGEQWTVFPIEESAFDSISWSVSTITSIIWLENEELIKTFEGPRYQNGFVVDTLQLILSEEHGFLQYVPFDKWWVNASSEQTLFGWTDGDQKAGFTHSFEDYFDLPVGSVFKYRSYRYISRREILRDSIISSFLDEEGLHYTVHRHTKTKFLAFESNPPIVDSVTYSYDTLDINILRSRYRADFEATPGWLFYEEGLYSNDHWGFRFMDTLMLDTNNIVRVCADVGIAFDWNVCQYNGVVDNFEVASYCLGQGIGWINEKYFTSYLTLLGYDTPNGSAGDYDPIEIITDVNTFDIEQNGLSVYPNPTNDWLNIKLEPQLGKSAVISIKNMESKDVFMKVVSGLETDLNLNVQDLPKGVYTVIIITKKKIYSSLFVKF